MASSHPLVFSLSNLVAIVHIHWRLSTWIITNLPFYYMSVPLNKVLLIYLLHSRHHLKVTQPQFRVHVDIQQPNLAVLWPLTPVHILLSLSVTHTHGQPQNIVITWNCSPLEILSSILIITSPILPAVPHP